MPNYLFSYRGQSEHAAAPEGDPMAAWMAWFGQLGDAVVEMGNPIFARTVVGTATPGTDLSGFSIITAPDLDAATALADGCPVLAAGGTVEVGELTDM